MQLTITKAKHHVPVYHQNLKYLCFSMPPFLHPVPSGVCDIHPAKWQSIISLSLLIPLHPFHLLVTSHHRRKLQLLHFTNCRDNTTTTKLSPPLSWWLGKMVQGAQFFHIRDSELLSEKSTCYMPALERCLTLHRSEGTAGAHPPRNFSCQSNYKWAQIQTH